MAGTIHGHERRRGRVARLLLLAPAALVLLALVCPAGTALAGRAKARKDRPPRALRFDREPPLSFLAGELRSDGRGGWEIEGRPIAFTPTCSLEGATLPLRTVQPRDGDHALLMGTWVGRTFLARRGVVEEAFSGVGGLGDGDPSAIRVVDPRSEEARDIPQ